MAKVGTAEFDVQLQRAKVRAEVAAVGNDIEQGLGQSARNVEAEFKRTARTLVGGFVAYKGARFVADTIRSASDLREQEQKANIVFGESVDIVNKFGETSAKAFGISKREATASSGVFGNLFRTIGVGEQQSAKMSTTLVGLAADLASFSNTDPATALEALQSGLVGLTRPLRQYGINLDQASLKQEAMKLGLYSGKGALTASARAQAAYVEIIKQSHLAQGDFARTSGNLAQQQKILAAQFADTKAKIGEALLPSAKSTVVVLNDMLDAFQVLPGPVEATTVGLAGLAVVAGLFGPTIKAGFQFLGDVDRKLGSFASSVKATALGTKSTAVATAELTTEELAASQAAIAEATAHQELVASLRLVGASEEEVAIATGEKAAAQEAAAAAASKEGVANASLSASLGPLALGAAAVYGVYKGLSRTFAEHQGSLKNTPLDPAILGATKKQLAEAAAQLLLVSRLSGKNAFAGQDLTVLRTMKADVEATGGKSIPLLNKAIRDGEVAAKRAARASKQYGDALDGVGSAADRDAAQEAKLYELRKGLYAGAIAAFDKGQEIETAKLAEVGTSKALAQAVKDEATARRAATGDSDEYRAAVAEIANAKRDEAKADADVTRTELALTDAREAATRALRDERLDNERAIISAERAKFALADSRDALARVQDDPRSTDRQKAEALLDVRDAELSLQEAQNRRGDSAADLAKAEKAGVEGSAQVVSAKEAIANALDQQRQAEKRTADASKAAAKVLTDAKAAVATAADKTRQAVLEEAAAHETVAEKAYGAAAGNYAFLQSLLHSVQVLDPTSPLVKEIDAYIADLEALRVAQDVAGLGLPGGIPSAGHTTAPDELPSRPQGAPHAPGTAGRSLHGSVTNNNVTVNTTNGPSAKDVADELTFGRH